MPTQQNMIFHVEGVHVSSDHVCNEKFCAIHLDNLSNDTSGAYRCEVSGDAPEFKLSHETSNMTVAGEFYCYSSQTRFPGIDDFIVFSHAPHFNILNDEV
jgi:hypothetical protein